MRKASKLELTDQDREKLEQTAKSGKSEVDQVRRAKILLRKADGLSSKEIAKELGINRHTVDLWIGKYRQKGNEEKLEQVLKVAPGRGRKEQISGEARTWLIAEACTKPTELGQASEMWTYSTLTKYVRKAAADAGFPRLSTVSENEVFRILEKSKIKPFRIKYYCERRDPDFDSKMRNLLLLYKKLSMGSEGDVHVLSYDEKPGIQALGTTVSDLPPDTKGHGTIQRDYEYRRLGTLTLMAAIDLQNGKAVPMVRKTHLSKDYIDFLKKLDSMYPKDNKIRLVLDNLRVHTSKETRAYLATVPGRFEFVFTPKHGSWLNLIESFFSKLTKQMLRGIRVNSSDELKERIYKYFNEINEDPVVYHWQWGLSDIDVNGDLNTTTLLDNNV